VNVYPFIEAEMQGGQHVVRACELLRVSRAAYYADRDDQPGARHREDAELTELITKVHQESKWALRSSAHPRRTAPPRPSTRAQADRPVDARRRGARLRAEAMAEDHHPRPGGSDPVGPDLSGLQHQRRAHQHPLVGDITYLRTAEGWLFFGYRRYRPGYRLSTGGGVRPRRPPAH